MPSDYSHSGPDEPREHLPDHSLDPLPRCPDGKCRTIPISWCQIPFDITTATYANTRRLAIHIHLSLRHPQCSLSRPPDQTPTSIPLRPHPLPTGQDMPHLQHLQACPKQALLPLQYLRRQIRPPLSLGQQLPRPRKLPLVPPFVN